MTARRAKLEGNQGYLRRIERALRPLSRPSSVPDPYEEGAEEARRLAEQFQEALKNPEQVTIKPERRSG